MVFANLLGNAAEAMQGDGTITIQGTVVSSDRVQIAVRDSGPGVAPELHERIFDFAFSRPSPGQAARAGETGLRAVVGQDADEPPGRVGDGWESDGHHGTTFWLSLPRAGASQ